MGEGKSFREGIDQSSLHDYLGPMVDKKFGSRVVKKQVKRPAGKLRKGGWGIVSEKRPFMKGKDPLTGHEVNLGKIISKKGGEIPKFLRIYFDQAGINVNDPRIAQWLRDRTKHSEKLIADLKKEMEAEKPKIPTGERPTLQPPAQVPGHERPTMRARSTPEHERPGHPDALTKLHQETLKGASLRSTSTAKPTPRPLFRGIGPRRAG